MGLLLWGNSTGALPHLGTVRTPLNVLTGARMQPSGRGWAAPGSPRHQRPSLFCWRLDFIAAGGPWGQHLCGAGQEPLLRASLQTEAPTLYILLLL